MSYKIAGITVVDDDLNAYVNSAYVSNVKFGTISYETSNSYSLQGESIIDSANITASFNSYTINPQLNFPATITIEEPQVRYNYVVGGLTSITAATNQIEKYSTSYDGTGFVVASLTNLIEGTTIGLNNSQAYAFGGSRYTGGLPPVTVYNTIQKFPFATDSNATLVEYLVTPRTNSTSHDQYFNSSTHIVGGGTGPGLTNLSSVEKFDMNSDVLTSSLFSLSSARREAAGLTSIFDSIGYVAGGYAPPSPSSTLDIQKFDFNSSSSSSSIGNMTRLRGKGVMAASTDYFGYIFGGSRAPIPTSNPLGTVKSIERFPFADDSTRNYVGDMNLATGRGAVNSTSGFGGDYKAYISGGDANFPGTARYIQNQYFTMSSNISGSILGNLSVNKSNCAGLLD